MDEGHEPGVTGRTAAAREGEVDVDARDREQAAASVRAVSGPAARDTTATDGAERRRVDGSDSGREGGRFRVRLFVPAWRRRTTRDVLAAGDAERERLAQDLHDGVQQHLTALRIRLGLAADRFAERGETEAGAVLQGFGDDVDHLIDGLRDLARGIYPALLTSYGLAAALVSAGVHSGQPVTVHASGVRRCRPEVEIAVYFACLAALDNAARHAGPVPVSVDLCDTVARWTSRSATQARGLTRRIRRSARGSRTCATASPPSAGRSRLTPRRRAERGCMAACRTPAGDNALLNARAVRIVGWRVARAARSSRPARYPFEAHAIARAIRRQLAQSRVAIAPGAAS
jgi:Histidine kinase